MQKDWMKNTEDGLMTGILVWDLSSAFDTLDIDLFFKKWSFMELMTSRSGGFILSSATENNKCI